MFLKKILGDIKNYGEICEEMSLLNFDDHDYR